jgi:PhnB protein
MPFLRVSDARAAIDFYERAFDAVQTQRLEHPDGRIGRCVLRIGDAEFSVHDNPLASHDDSSVGFMLTVDDVDGTVERARRAGATVVDEPTDQFHGARQANIVDPEGFLWSLVGSNTLPRQEVARRWEALHPRAQSGEQ